MVENTSTPSFELPSLWQQGLATKDSQNRFNLASSVITLLNERIYQGTIFTAGVSGSTARGSATNKSDIDLDIILDLSGKTIDCVSGAEYVRTLEAIEKHFVDMLNYKGPKFLLCVHPITLSTVQSTLDTIAAGICKTLDEEFDIDFDNLPSFVYSTTPLGVISNIIFSMPICALGNDYAQKLLELKQKLKNSFGTANKKIKSTIANELSKEITALKTVGTFGMFISQMGGLYAYADNILNKYGLNSSQRLLDDFLR